MPLTAVDSSAEQGPTSQPESEPAEKEKTEESASPTVASEGDREAVYPRGIKLLVIMAALVSAARDRVDLSTAADDFRALAQLIAQFLVGIDQTSEHQSGLHQVGVRTSR